VVITVHFWYPPLLPLLLISEDLVFQVHVEPVHIISFEWARSRCNTPISPTGLLIQFAIFSLNFLVPLLTLSCRLVLRKSLHDCLRMNPSIRFSTSLSLEFCLQLPALQEISPSDSTRSGGAFFFLHRATPSSYLNPSPPGRIKGLPDS